MRSSEIDAALTPPEPFSVLLFDCDGTLVDSVTAYERAWERAFAAKAGPCRLGGTERGPASVRRARRRRGTP
jgi:beta-phosphoglucomutase-like phosphatase (HAD superfamily)